MEVRVVATRSDFEAALAVRKVVFVEEQGVSPDLEIDEFDVLEGSTLHVLARIEDRVVGAGRLRPIDPKVGKLERLAVIKDERGQGVGRALTVFLESIAVDRGMTQLLLNSQESARGFYEKLGYIAYGEPFMEASIAHIAMRKTLR